MKEYYLKLNAYITINANSLGDAVEQAEAIGQDMGLDVRGVDIIDISEHWDEDAYREIWK